MQVDGLPDAHVRVNGATSQPDIFLDQLNPNDRIAFDLVIENARPLSGTIFVLFESALGTSLRLSVRIRLSIRTPLLIFTPDPLAANIVRGTQKVIDVSIVNEGEVAADNVVIDVPTDTRLSLVSFAIANNTDPTSLSISPGGSASFSLAITVENDEGLGEMSGRIAVITALSTSYVSYRFAITSIRNVNLTVRVEDEYTYFAAGAPLLQGAFIRLRNPRRGYDEVLTSPESGRP